VELLAGCEEERMFTLCSPWAEIAARHYLKRVGEKKKGNWKDVRWIEEKMIGRETKPERARAEAGQGHCLAKHNTR
jgi:hypothetical protein